MTNSILSPRGVFEKIKTLYALPDTYRHLHATAIRTDFRYWIKSNFILSSGQKRYLDSISDEAANYYGLQSSICFIYRLDIKFIHPVEELSPDKEIWIETKNTVKITALGTEIKVKGSLIFRLFTF